MADYYVIRGDKIGFSVDRERDFNWAAVIAVVVGILFGYWVNQTFPTFLFGLAGIVSSFVVYVVLAKLAPDSLGATLTGKPTGAEAALA